MSQSDDNDVYVDPEVDALFENSDESEGGKLSCLSLVLIY
jgi:hypothetical protein